ncbi:MAG: hypothetical protein RIB84_15735 [Sneathiellaceae bacterium]
MAGEDHEARRMAATAMQKIQGHEDRCTERWMEARKSLDELQRRWWWLLTGIIGAMGAGTVGFFALWMELQKTLTTIQITLSLLPKAAGG